MAANRSGSASLFGIPLCIVYDEPTVDPASPDFEPPRYPGMDKVVRQPGYKMGELYHVYVGQHRATGGWPGWPYPEFPTQFDKLEWVATVPKSDPRLVFYTDTYPEFQRIFTVGGGCGGIRYKGIRMGIEAIDSQKRFFVRTYLEGIEDEDYIPEGTLLDQRHLGPGYFVGFIPMDAPLEFTTLIHGGPRPEPEMYVLMGWIRGIPISVGALKSDWDGKPPTFLEVKCLMQSREAPEPPFLQDQDTSFWGGCYHFRGKLAVDNPELEILFKNF